MAHVRYEGPTSGHNAVWAGDEMSREHVLAMGGMLDISAFPEGFAEGGLLAGRTFAERAAEAPFGPWAAGDEEFYLLARSVYAADADEANRADCTFYRHGGLVYEGGLPAGSRAAAALAVIRANYEVIA